MAAVDQVVSVTISNQTASVPQVSFGVPLIVGPSAPGWSDPVRVYAAPADLLADGYTTASPEYVYALELYSQAIVPTQYLVGRRSAPATQVDSFQVTTLTSGRQYKVTVNGAVYSYTAGSSDSQQAVLTALGTAIAAAQPVTSGVSGTGATATLTLTATSAGTVVTYSAIDAQLSRTTVTAAAGIAQDLATISASNDTWYGLVVAGASDADILQAAAYIESVRKIFVAVSSSAAIATSATSDVLSTLKSKAYARTALVFSPGAAAQGIEAAWVGGQLPQTPGSNTWTYRTLVGISPDTLSANQVATVIGQPIGGVAGKNGNVYTVVGGVPVTQQGMMAKGQYIDITIGLDWLQAAIQNNIYSAIVAANKIPFTDEGVGVLMSAVRAAIDQGVANQLIDGDTISITAPPVLQVLPSQRAQRIAPTITFGCRLKGAIQSVRVRGNVTV